MSDEAHYPTTNIEDRITSLERRVDTLESNRPGRKAKPLIRSEVGVCGLHPDIDSATCTDATVYRHQQGCLGTACVLANETYYREYRALKAEAARAAAEALEAEEAAAAELEAKQFLVDL